MDPESDDEPTQDEIDCGAQNTHDVDPDELFDGTEDDEPNPIPWSNLVL